MKTLLMTISLFLIQFSYSFVDEHSEYNKDIFGEAKSKATNMYGAWSNNMAYHIERNTKEGTIVDGQTDNRMYNVDGFGNIVIKDGAIITAPIVIKEDFSNSTMIQKQRH